MQHDWMIDVLSDLRTYARNHEMGKLEEQLDGIILTVTKDIKLAQDMKATLGPNEQKDNTLFRTANAS